MTARDRQRAAVALVRMLTVDDVAHKLQVRPGTLYEWRLRGIGPRWHKIGGGRLRMDEGDLEVWLAEQAETGHRPAS